MTEGSFSIPRLHLDSLKYHLTSISIGSANCDSSFPMVSFECCFEVDTVTVFAVAQS